MKIKYTKTQLEKELKTATKHIRQANKGLPWKVKVCRDYDLVYNDNTLSMQIHYMDGDLKDRIYYICL